MRPERLGAASVGWREEEPGPSEQWGMEGEDQGQWIQGAEALPSTVRTSEFSRSGKALEILKDRRGLQFMGLLWLLPAILGVYGQGTGYCHDPR